MVLLIALLVPLIASDSASALGRDDSCPPAADEKNVIVSDNPVIYGTAASDHICGGPGPNIIIGGILDDEIYGGGGDDVLIGGHGVDILDGGSGNDWLRGGTNRDTYVGGTSGSGNDTASFADMTPVNGVAGIIIDLTPEGPREREFLRPGIANAGEIIEDMIQIDGIVGSAFDDEITTAPNVANQVNGGFGDDTLNGTEGNDSLWGEDGSDTCTNDGLPAPCADGQGVHRPSGAYVFAENRSGKDFGLVVMGAEGSVADWLNVTRLNETQLRVAGTRSTAGNSCRNTNETTVDCNLAAAQYIVVWGDGGNDLLAVGNNLLNGPGSIDVNGGPGNDYLAGNSGGEVLFSGEGGTDTLTGNGGSDALISEGDPVGSGGDNLNAGAGDDQLVSDNACSGVRLTGGPDNDIIGFARQTTVGGVTAGVHAQLGEESVSRQAWAIDEAGQEVPGCLRSTINGGGETLEGTNQSDVLYGNDAPNTIWGRRGDDTLYGNGGNDTVKGQDGDDRVWGYNGIDSLYGGNGWDDLRALDGVADSVIDCGDGHDPGAERDSVDPVGAGCNDGIPTETFITLDGISNGTPGTASVHGHVLHNGNPVSGRVNVNFQKSIGGTWVTMSTAQRTLDANGYYEVLRWGVGVGDWRVRAVFPQQNPYAQSESEYKTFSIELVPTETFLTLDGYQNGTPGTASVHGHVLHNGNPVSGRVNVNFQKLVSGRWETMSTAQRTLDSNGYYEVVDWGVGVGEWRVRAVFPEQGDYAQSESEYKTFSIQPVPTNTYLTLDGTLNGQPGYVSVHGNVQRTNGVPATGTVNVNFQKWINGSWQTLTEQTATRTLVNGSYDINFRSVGVGQWRVRAVFPEQGDYAQSESEYHSFNIGSGYRLIGRQSGRCMSLSANNAANGTPIILWDCSSNPVPWDGQVFTLVPMEESGQFYQVKINSTGKCVDVTGVSTADGAYLQEWDCLGPGQWNQLWEVIPISGQWPYIALRARHSGKCADVLGQATGNGARIGQWGCWWGGNQQWQRQAIN